MRAMYAASWTLAWTLTSCDPEPLCRDEAVLITNVQRRIQCDKTAAVGFQEVPQGLLLTCTCPKPSKEVK